LTEKVENEIPFVPIGEGNAKSRVEGFKTKGGTLKRPATAPGAY